MSARASSIVIVDALISARVIALTVAKTKCLWVAVITRLAIFVVAVPLAAASKDTPIIYAAVRIYFARYTTIDKGPPAGATIFSQTEDPRTRGTQIAIFMRLAVTISIGVQNAAPRRVAGIIMVAL